MRIVLTGGTGFIGSHFLQQALAADNHILAIRRSPDSQPRIPICHQPLWLNCQLDKVMASYGKVADDISIEEMETMDDTAIEQQAPEVVVETKMAEEEK